VGSENGRGDFAELFELIRDYARRSVDHQAMALKLIGGAYLPTQEAGRLQDARQVVDRLLAEHDYFVPHGNSGGLHPQSVYAVLNVAKYSGTEADRRWGANCLFKIMEALSKRAQNSGSYPKHAADAALLSTALAQLSNAAQLSQAQAGSLN
jgi:hypothetical protein